MSLSLLLTKVMLTHQMFDNVTDLQIDEDMTARISMADAKLSFQCPGRMYSPAWMAPEGISLSSLTPTSSPYNASLDFMSHPVRNILYCRPII